MAVTDDERRRVAARLRMSDERDAAGFDCLLAEAVRGREFCETPCEECHARLLGELADLIDPGESGQNRDRNQDTVQKESPGVQMACECDRDALLALEDEMFEDATGLALISQLEKNEELQDLQSTMAKALMDYAHRIREACNVVDAG